MLEAEGGSRSSDLGSMRKPNKFFRNLRISAFEEPQLAFSEEFSCNKKNHEINYMETKCSCKLTWRDEFLHTLEIRWCKIDKTLAKPIIMAWHTGYKCKDTPTVNRAHNITWSRGKCYPRYHLEMRCFQTRHFEKPPFPCLDLQKLDKTNL